LRRTKEKLKSFIKIIYNFYRCNNRIQRLYYLNKHMRIFMGHPTEAIYFYRPQGLDEVFLNFIF